MLRPGTQRYLAFLVRQGARLTEPERRAGAMAGAELTRYAALAPAGQATSLVDMETIYRTLKSSKAVKLPQDVHGGI